jgi:16S rRNA (guanine527-N7)-methyltransferase
LKIVGVDSGVIGRLLQPYAKLTDAQLALTATYIDLLLKWNARVNLTAVRDPEEMVTRHFGESFFAACQLVPPDWHGIVIDVGSGAGFPGVPIAMWAPGAEVTLLESNGKKTAFLNEVLHALELKNARVVNQRAEVFAGKAELVTMRAVEKFERALLAASGLVAPGGRIGLMIGASQVPVARRTEGIAWGEPINIPGGHSRVLLIGTKLDAGGKSR